MKNEKEKNMKMVKLNSKKKLSQKKSENFEKYQI